MSPAPITYYALDLEERELKRTLEQLSDSSVGPELTGKVDTMGMWGTYDGGLKFVEEGGLQGKRAIDGVSVAPTPVAAARARSDMPIFSSDVRDHSPSEDSISSNTQTANTDPDSIDTALSTPDPSAHAPLHLLFLGSSLGNFDRGADAEFLRGLPLRPGSGDTLLLGLDHGNNKEKIERAYDDRKGITKEFIFNGLKAAGKALGDENIFDEEKWEYIGKYNEQERTSILCLFR